MTVTAVRKDAQSRTMTLEAEFDASPERVWQLWADPRQLERWWGPPTYPATVDAHDLRPGGRVEYHMTGPEGDQPRGFWEVDEVQPPHRLVFRDGFANEDGTPNTELPTTTARVTIEEMGGAEDSDVDRERVSDRRGDGAARRHGHGGGPDAGDWPDRRDPGRGSGRGRWRPAMTAASFADGIANLVAEADPALELRESIEGGTKLAQTAHGTKEPR